MHQHKYSVSFSHRRPWRRKNRAQALLEFALALPILLALVFGIVDFALIFQAWLSVENIARQTVRYAVTGEYDPAFCASAPAADGVPDCAGDSYIQEQDYARLQSIKAMAKHWEVALFKKSSVAQSAKGYINVTVCSNRDADHSGASDFTHITPVMASTIYAQCLPTQDAGSPGDNVFIFVDFNHPLLTPFLNQVWPMIHLVSYRQGVVETFRTPRSIVQPGEGIEPSTDTPTPSNTPVPPTATDIPATATKTNTPTATVTPTPNCAADFTFVGGMVETNYSGGTQPRVEISISNSSASDTNLSSLTFNWSAYDATNPGQTLNRIRLNGSNLTGTDDPSSPSTWSGSALLAHNTVGLLQFDFLNADLGWPGIVPANTFGLTVGLSNGCVVTVIPAPFTTYTPSKTPTRTPVTPSLTPSITLTPSRTPTASKTPTKTPVTPRQQPSRLPQRRLPSRHSGDAEQDAYAGHAQQDANANHHSDEDTDGIAKSDARNSHWLGGRICLNPTRRPTTASLLF